MLPITGTFELVMSFTIPQVVWPVIEYGKDATSTTPVPRPAGQVGGLVTHSVNRASVPVIAVEPQEYTRI